MRANELHLRLTALALAAMTFGSVAVAQNAPAAPAAPAASSAAPAAAPAVALPALPPVGTPVNVAGQPLPGAKAPGSPASLGKELVYRDPAMPLSIEDVSELQAKKANSEMYKKFGLTDVPPPKPVVVAPVPVVAPGTPVGADGKPLPVPVVVPKLNVVTLGVWSRSGDWRAEALVDGGFRALRVGDLVSQGAVVKSISRQGIEVEVTPLPKKRVPKAPAAEGESKPVAKPVIKRAKSTQPAPVKTKTYWARVGQSVEMPL
jgi:hypothetical protein